MVKCICACVEGDAEQDPLFQSLLQAGVGSRDDLSRDKGVFFVKVQEPNSVVFPLLTHHSSILPSGEFSVVCAWHSEKHLLFSPEQAGCLSVICWSYPLPESREEWAEVPLLDIISLYFAEEK